MSIRELNRNDYNELAKFLSIFAAPNLPVETYQKKFKIWWDLNTHCEDSDLLGWVIVDENEKPGNQIKGFMGNIPRKYKIEGKIIKTANATSWFVNPEYRKLGVSSKLMKKLRMEGKKYNWELIRWNCNFDNLTANNLYLKIAKKLDWNTFEMKI